MVLGKFFFYAALCLSLITRICGAQQVGASADSIANEGSTEKISLFEEAYRTGNLKKAEINLNWLLKNSPGMKAPLYVQGAKIFDQLAVFEKDPARRRIYVDSLMILYDLQVKHCGDEPTVAHAIARSSLKYNQLTKPISTLHALDRLFALQGNNTPDDFLVPYMETVKLCSESKQKALTEPQIMERYNRVMHVLDAKTRAANQANKSVDVYNRAKDDIDALLISMIQINCSFVKRNLEPRFKKDPSDITLARKIFSFMLQGNCVDDPLWLQAGETIHAKSIVKDFALTKTLALKHYYLGNYERSEKLFSEALPLATLSRDKLEVLLYLGDLKAKTDKPEARSLFLQVLEEDRGNKAAYEKIGDLYYSSVGDCPDESAMERGLVYLLAADYYQRAGNGRKVALARQGFPTKQEMVRSGYKSGQLTPVGCWIGESTMLRTKN